MKTAWTLENREKSMKNKYEIGDIVYLKVPDGDSAVINAIVLYESHIEYLVRFEDRGVSQLTEPELTDVKIIV